MGTYEMPPENNMEEWKEIKKSHYDSQDYDAWVDSLLLEVDPVESFDDFEPYENLVDYYTQQSGEW